LQPEKPRLATPTAGRAELNRNTSMMIQPPTDPAAKKTVLVADRSEHTRYRLSRALEQEGHRVYTASDVKNAKATASVLRVDLLMADIDLPGVMDGDLLGIVRERAGGKPVAVVALATKTSPRLADAPGVGFSDCLMKPLNDARLRSITRKALGEPRNDVVASLHTRN
jgi:two-component system OmpR family response regulator